MIESLSGSSFSFIPINRSVSVQLNYVYNLAVLSAPVEKIQGCVGCQITEKTPNSFTFLCESSFFSGTIRGFCKRSLEKRGNY